MRIESGIGKKQILGVVLGGGIILSSCGGDSPQKPLDSNTPVKIPGTVAPDFKTNIPPPATVTVESPTATPTPESKHMNYEIAHENVYEGFSLAVPVDMASATQGTFKKDGQLPKEITQPGIAEIYLDETFTDEKGTVQDKTQKVIYTFLYHGYLNSNPDSGVTLEQFIADAKAGKENKTDPKYNFVRRGTGQEDITFNEQTFLQFMPLSKNLSTYAQPFQEYAYASEVVGDNKVRIGIWAENKGALAPDYNDPSLQQKDFEITDWIPGAMKVLIVYPDFYTTSGNLNPEQTSKLYELNDLYFDELYRQTPQGYFEGAIKAKASPLE